jgi:hypothetical protein
MEEQVLELQGLLGEKLKKKRGQHKQRSMAA